MFEGLASPWHLLIVLAVFMATFGSKRLPEMARSLGQSARILRAESRGLHQDEQDPPAVKSGAVVPRSGSDAAVRPATAPTSGARFDIYTGLPLPLPPTDASAGLGSGGSLTKDGSRPPA